ncbi:MAG: hypothetical protein KJZ98_07175 [Burkholderiaceae bacterium]|jgi:hypothetical protein|nr:hypothetical protein [Burkholderiaceae bacterium]
MIRASATIPAGIDKRSAALFETAPQADWVSFTMIAIGTAHAAFSRPRSGMRASRFASDIATHRSTLPASRASVLIVQDDRGEHDRPSV